MCASKMETQISKVEGVTSANIDFVAKKLTLNIEESTNRAVASGIKPEELLLTTISRYQWMNEMNGSKNRELFKQLVNNGLGYLMMPIGIKDKNKPMEESNLIIDFDYTIKMKNVTFKSGISLKDNDMCKVVLNKPRE
jgi:copper chaperone CopZ